MRTVFFGCTEFGYRCCEALLESGQEVVGIFTIPQEFRISYSATPVRNVCFKNFEQLARQHSIPLVNVEGKMSDAEYVKTLQAWQPDFGLAAGWYYLVPRSIRELFPRGLAGIHASLLPKYRGGAPLVWAMINGETRTGVTLFYFDDGVDTGDIIAQKEFEITEGDTIKSVYEKATQAGVELVSEQAPLIARDEAARTAQDHSAATVFPQRKPEDGLIDWSRSANEIRNFIRAQTRPYPGAFTIINNKEVTIWDADVIELPKAD